ncbi:MAG TPA: integrase core domain-containing protein [Dokdonella sp.]
MRQCDFGKTSAAHGVESIMSRKGNCWHNAAGESFFATLRNEEATGVYQTKAAAYAAVARYIHDFYDPSRLHSALGPWLPLTQRLRQEAEASRLTPQLLGVRAQGAGLRTREAAVFTGLFFG